MGAIVKVPLVIAKRADGSDVYVYQGSVLPDGLKDGEVARLADFLEPVPVEEKAGPTVADLKAEIEARNAQRSDDSQIVPASAKKADLVAALAADDAAGLATVD
jgi:hypothetical protein